MSLFDPLYRFAGNLLSPAGTGARLSILIFHRVLSKADPIFPTEPTAATFDIQLRALKAVFNVLPLTDAVERLKAGTLPARAACITFDDGYADNYTQALPILQRHGLHATFFVATAYLDGGRMFNDTVIEAVRHAHEDHIDLSDMCLGKHDVSTPQAKARAIAQILSRVKYLPLDERETKVDELARWVAGTALPDDLMMTTEQLTALHDAGMEIGAHTHWHPILASIDHEHAVKEILAGKNWLETTLGAPVTVFAYPNGKPGVDYRIEQASLPRQLGFQAAVSTHWGASNKDTDIYQMPRFTPWSWNPDRFTQQLLNNLRKTA